MTYKGLIKDVARRVLELDADLGGEKDEPTKMIQTTEVKQIKLKSG